MKTSIKFIVLALMVIICFSAINRNESYITWEKDTGEKHGFKIDSSVAYPALIAYKDYINEVNIVLKKSDSLKYHNDTEKLNYGVAVQLNELRQVLWNSENHPTHSANSIDKDSLFLMNAILNKKGIEQTETIFALKCYDEVTGSYASEWKFFDFTRPCPTSCAGYINYHQQNY